MSMQENLPTRSHRNSGALYAQRKRKNDFAQMAMPAMEKVLKFWVEVLEDPMRPIDERFRAADSIANRAVGAVPKPALEEGEGDQGALGGATHITFQWLPADPSDNSKVIEPE